MLLSMSKILIVVHKAIPIIFNNLPDQKSIKSYAWRTMKNYESSSKRPAITIGFSFPIRFDHPKSVIQMRIFQISIKDTKNSECSKS
jgi:hypothetical protein